MLAITAPRLLLCYFIVCVAVTFLWPTVRLWRRERINALVLPRDDSAHGLVASWFRGVVLATLLLLVALSVGVPLAAVGPLRWLQAEAIGVVGWGLLGVSLAWIVVAQAQMGRSWRIGIDGATRPPLVQTGLFGRSRNPIFLGMRLNLAGLFLVLPNAATLALLLLGEAMMQLQVRLEEAHLSATFGADYDAYRRKVPRWL
ncbi:MAG: isoprenylcysteine carboxylmethyltransferase family protein [Sphingomonadaceae bacterium]|nr:isoprenylcysteine carboxylmethyltransferase family protein [Sphingomonadaceae bacterium]